jgi:uracil-DNA glycosylase
MSGSKARDLERLAAEVRTCRICIERPKGKPLPHEPRPVLRVSTTARIAVCGQAPGTRVHASGLPFSDPSGVRLRQWMGVSEDEFYDVSRIAFIPMGFCFPGLDAKGGDMPPRRECADAWRARVIAALPQIELFLLVGRHAHLWHLREGASGGMTATVERAADILAAAAAPRCLPLPHPSWRNSAWLQRNSWFAERVVPLLQREVWRLLKS